MSFQTCLTYFFVWNTHTQKNVGTIDICYLDKKSSFVPEKKVFQVWNDMRASKWWQNFNFCMRFLFKESISNFLNPYLGKQEGWKKEKQL